MDGYDTCRSDRLSRRQACLFRSRTRRDAVFGKIHLSFNRCMVFTLVSASSSIGTSVENDMPLYFYSVREAFGCFSNFSPHGFERNGKYWPTSEHYFQAMKFPGAEAEELIRQAPTPKEAANLGRSRFFTLRPDWESVKDSVMRDAVLEKFRSHKDIREILLGTGNEEIVEKAAHDAYWGCGADGSGLNMLGKILVETRERLRSESGSGA